MATAVPEAGKSDAKAGKGKKIVVCCDGTGNKFIDDPQARDSNSNVVKFYTTLRIDNDQVGYYHPGVGTAGDPRARHRWGRFWSRLLGLAFAAGFKDNVLDAYRYLMESYDDGDTVYLIGFSRGAYTVRALAGLLDGYGLLCKGNEGHLEYAWNEYVNQHDDRNAEVVQPNHAFKETFSRKGFRVHFMGIWDTVSSVGWVSTPLRLWGVARAPIIDTGRHAISIDERRCFYRNNLWRDGVSEIKVRRPQERAASKMECGQDLMQVWFAGVHSDVGGSYPQRESVLANVALEWLIGEAKQAGANIKDNMVNLVLGRPAQGNEDEADQRKIATLEDLYKLPTVSKVHRSLQWAWYLLEVLPHRYFDLDEGAEQWRTPLGMRRRIPRNAYVHRSAKERMEVEAYRYRPKNVLGGAESLHPVSVPGQPEGTMFQYRPKSNPRPIGNTAPVRWAVMAAVTTLDVAVAAGVLKGLWWMGKKALGR